MLVKCPLVQILVSNYGKIWFSLHCPSSPSCMNEYEAIDSGGYLCMNIIHALIAAWLNASQCSYNGVRLNCYARNLCVK